jgi:AraC family ethanolamine operon transcriptional activator
LTPSAILSVQHFANFDEFRPSDILGAADSLPRDHRAFSFSRAALALPDARLVLQRTFSRDYEADLVADGCGIVIPMDDHFRLEANREVMDHGRIALLRGRAPVHIIEPKPNAYMMLRLHSVMQTRGWSDFDRGYRLFAASGDGMRHLRSVLWNIAQSASACTEALEFTDIAGAIQETLYDALDQVLIVNDAVRARPRSFEQHRKLIARLDDVLRQQSTTAIYSDDVARRVGTSVRTLQTAMQAVHGMKLHHYIRLRRLWLVRRQLAKALPGTSVKAAALSNGFWHMGEFGLLYKSVFGEMASETLARAQGR